MQFAPLPEKSPSGNAGKYFSYREAWARITAACYQGFYLEAVTIQESIISDRLFSFLVSSGAVERRDEVYQYPSFDALIKVWKRFHPEPILTGEILNLQEEIDDWRRARNKAVHQIVKSHPGTATTPIDDFLKNAEDAAVRGVVLAKAMTNWSDKAVRRYRRHNPE